MNIACVAMLKLEHCNYYYYWKVTLENCFFAGTHTLFAGGAIYNSGHLAINNTEIVDNSSGLGGAIYNDGSLTVSNSIIKGNVGKNEFDVVEGNDIYSRGVLTITDEQSADSGFYEETTGEKLALPLVDYTGIARLTYLTVEQAAEYFAPEPPKEETEQPNPGDSSTEQPQPPEQPGDQTEDNTTGGEQPPQEPTQPSEGEGTGKPNTPDNGDQDISQKPVQPPQDPSEKPVEPPEDNRPVEQPEDNNPPADDEPTDNEPQVPEQPEEPPVVPPQGGETDSKPGDTSQQPQKPADSDRDNDDDSNPPADNRLSQRHIRPTVTIRDKAENKVQAPSDTPTTAQPPLVCNGAAIDTSKTVVLLGYKDGLLHEDDLLTRAQLAAIIYRLLDDKSITLYSNAEMTFDDIPADAWCAPYVKIMHAAGIVNGVGGGKYNPNGTVTWAHVITILSRFVKPQKYTLQHINYNGWAVKSVQTAVALSWIEDSVTFAPDAAITRGELTQLINGVLALYQ